MNLNPFTRLLRKNTTHQRNSPDTEQEPSSILQYEPLRYGDHVIDIEQYELSELPLSAYNVEFEEPDDITPLRVGSSLVCFFGEAEDCIRKLEDYGIEIILEQILAQACEEVENRSALKFISQKESELSSSESSDGLFTPFSELELGNTKEYPFPEHFGRWRDTISVASSYDAEAAWEIMKGPDPPSFKTPVYMTMRNWIQRIAGSIGCVVFWLICCCW